MSWNTDLFLTVNRYVGRWHVIDRIAVFGAKWAIYLLILGVGIYVYGEVDGDAVQLLSVGGAMMSVLVFALGTSYLLARLYPHERPETELPQSKQLIDLLPIEMWKSFPSDHTLIAFLLAYVMILSQGKLTAFGTLSFLWATYIALSRIVVGVHYPRDILGGFLLASLWGYICSRIFGFTLWMLPV